MSDSDEDLMQTMRLQHERTAISTRAPSMRILSYKPKMSSSIMPQYERQRQGTQYLDQQSVYHRRTTSLMSVNNFPDSQIHSYYNRYPQCTSSARSEINGRGASPMSVRSINSNASLISAFDITWALENTKFDQNEWKQIHNAFKKQMMNNRFRKRMERRKKLKSYVKGNRYRSGDDSGDQASDSSVSSNDCRSTRTFYKVSKPRSVFSSNVRASIKQVDIYQDCTEKLKEQSIKNMFTIKKNIVNENNSNTIQHQTDNSLQNSQKPINVTLKERFEKSSSTLLPSQRFNKSIVNQNNIRNARFPPKNTSSMRHTALDNNENLDSDSDNEEIFSEMTVKENTVHMPHKRVSDNSENIYPEKKRCKMGSPKKQNELPNTTQTSDFNFKKPRCPARASANIKRSAIPERVIAMSKQPENITFDLTKNIQQNSNLNDTQQKLPVNSTEIEDSTNQSEVSMRPSFIKRKLFSQKMNECKNLNSDDLAVVSPQAKLYSGKEKNKVRKLVTSQSCLSRDILGDDNVLDLIHKIITPEQMNITTATNNKGVSKNTAEEEDKWDVMSVISTCNNGDISDTFTDEEIFKAPANNTKEVKKTDNIVEENDVQPKCFNKTQCKVVIQKLQPTSSATSNLKARTVDCIENKHSNKRTVSSCVRSFWDTETESEMEDDRTKSWDNRMQINQGTELKKAPIDNFPNLNLNKKCAVKGTILTVRQNCRNKTMDHSTRSDISRVSKRKVEEDHQENIQNNNRLNKLEDKEKVADVIPQTKKQATKVIESKKVSKLTSGSSKTYTEKPKAKTTQNKESIASRDSKTENKCNTSRESIRLKEKNKKNGLDTNVKNPMSRQPLESKENSSPQAKPNKCSKKTRSNLNRSAKQTAKINISTSLSDSSFNISISSRGRIRRIFKRCM